MPCRYTMLLIFLVYGYRVADPDQDPVNNYTLKCFAVAVYNYVRFGNFAGGPFYEIKIFNLDHSF